MISFLLFIGGFYSLYLGRLAVEENQGSPAVLMKQKTKAPTKVWTSRSWWNEVPRHNEVRLINAIVSETRRSEKEFQIFL